MAKKTRKSKTERAQALQAAQLEREAEQNAEAQAEATATQEPEVVASTEAPAEQPAATEPEAQAAEGEEKTEGEEVVSHSIVPRKYRSEYKARGHARRCGDELSEKMESLVQDADGNLILANVYAIAKANGIEKTYHHLNPGQQRMNIGNILRRKLAEGDGKLHVPAGITGEEASTIAIEPYYSAAQKDAA